MADKNWNVEGHYTKDGVKKSFDNVYSAPSPSRAEKKAKADFTSYVAAKYEKGSFGKLVVTKVTEWTEKDRQALLKRIK
ncbi:hypothetical protein HWB79_gp170 [Streptomyces phage LukeCage]|jgi:hypothetical protein|uniref:Uncharacterized protein n=1 Tax=Streptomyces phage LukeCage TaxID=2283304 RepID=A0A345MGG1_9CAUD|nr:hypothetical protein HWB79_gp170 [Streptomyces phage LukeCage]AXH69642.1 hypothetical protein SEA_LUKECAGE_125 [Streptomyces phage LukeCage]